MAVVKGILFHVGNEVYGIGILNIRGIEKVANIFPIPNAPSYISGIINLRGDVIPVFNLRDKFGLPSEPVTDATKLIIAKSFYTNLNLCYNLNVKTKRKVIVI